MTLERRAALADMLNLAQTEGGVLAGVPAHLHPADLDEAYAIQDVIAHGRASPDAGYKIGLGSPAGIRKSGAGGPVFGRIAADRLHASGADVVLPAGVAAAVARTRIALEIVCSRLVGGAAQGLPLFVADDAGCHAVVVGEPFEGPIEGLPEVSLWVDGAPVGIMAEGDDAIDPPRTFASLIAAARQRGWPLTSGLVVMTGALIIPHVMTASAMVSAEAGGAAVSASLAFGEDLRSG